MSRVIKFRAWDGEKMNDLIPRVVATLGMLSDIASEPKWQVMQFTGLTDRNGVEIFEGDVVEFTYWWFDGNEAESTLTGEIVWFDSAMSFQLKGVRNTEWRRHVGVDENNRDYLTPFSELNFDEADFGVIGNIHENPELLEAKP